MRGLVKMSNRLALSSKKPASPHVLIVRRLRRAVAGRRGFTFVEVLFAIIILGIGMIMLAAMLPVAISQTALTRDQVTGKASVESGYAYIRAMIQANPNCFPPTHDVADLGLSGNQNVEVARDLLAGAAPYEYSVTGTAPAPRAGRVVPLTYHVAEQSNPSGNYLKAKDSLRALQGSRINSGDPLVQWLAFYRRDEGSDVVNVIVLSMRLRNTEVAKAYSGDTLKNESMVAGNGPFLVPVEIEDRLAEADVIKFVETGSDTIDRKVAATGAYVIIAHSPTLNATDDLRRPFRNNGRVFKLAARRDDLDSQANNARVWELESGFDLPSAKVGQDGVINTPDDIPDGSMNRTNSFETDNTAPMSRQDNNHKYNNVDGTRAWAWIIGRGLLDPTSATGTDNPYRGLAQDLSVLQFDVTIQ